MVSPVHAYVQTHQIVTTKYVQGFIYQLYINQAAYFKQKKRQGK